VSASTAPAAKAALLTIFAAAAGLSGVTLSWDQPTKDSDYTGEMIWLGDVQGSENWSSLGAQRREETYTVGLGVYVEQWGDDPADRRDAAVGGLGRCDRGAPHRPPLAAFDAAHGGRPPVRDADVPSADRPGDR
jgi:hypothetical protein